MHSPGPSRSCRRVSLPPQAHETLLLFLLITVPCGPTRFPRSRLWGCLLKRGLERFWQRRSCCFVVWFQKLCQKTLSCHWHPSQSLTTNPVHLDQSSPVARCLTEQCRSNLRTRVWRCQVPKAVAAGDAARLVACTQPWV